MKTHYEILNDLCAVIHDFGVMVVKEKKNLYLVRHNGLDDHNKQMVETKLKALHEYKVNVQFIEDGGVKW